MKQILSLIVSSLVLLSCMVADTQLLKNTDDVIYRKTVEFEQIDSLCNSHGFRPTSEELAVMKYFNDPEINPEWVYVKGDTTYTIRGIHGKYTFERHIDK